MNYRKEKQKLVEMRNDILRRYNSLLVDALRFGSIAGDLANSNLSEQETLDFVNFIANDPRTMKLTSLGAALMYVEHPEDKEISATLKRDIEINSHGRR